MRQQSGLDILRRAVPVFRTVADWYEPVGGCGVFAPPATGTSGATRRRLPMRLGDTPMRARIIGAAVLVGAALAVVASTASGGHGGDEQHHRLAADGRRRRRTGSRSSRPRTHAVPEASIPGVAVDVQYQTWGNHLQKFDATLAGGNAPDVIEMGNTEMTKYMAAGAFQDLTSDKASFAELEHLARRASRPPAAYSGKLYGVPYYAGLARRHLPDRPVQEGRHQGPDEPRGVHRGGEEARRRRTSDKGFSPVYIAGTDWYVAMGFVYDYGGSIARQVERQVERHAHLAEVDRGADRVQELLPRRRRGRARRPTRRTRTRTTSTPRGRPAR